MSATPTNATPEAPAPARSRRKTEVGVVTSDKMNKTRRVEIERLVPHPKYGKLLKSAARFATPTTKSQRKRTSATSSRSWRRVPFRSSKRWRIVRIVRPGAQQALGR